jgi:phthalate 4,5-dioxygenase oxygenase subunit
MPALLSQELPEPDGPPVRVRIMGEDLVAFRDPAGAQASRATYSSPRSSLSR